MSYHSQLPHKWTIKAPAGATEEEKQQAQRELEDALNAKEKISFGQYPSDHTHVGDSKDIAVVKAGSAEPKDYIESLHKWEEKWSKKGYVLQPPFNTALQLL